MSGRGAAEFGDPGGRRAFAAVGGVLPMGRAGERFDDGFELRPEADDFQGWIEQVGERAVERILRVGVV